MAGSLRCASCGSMHVWSFSPCFTPMQWLVMGAMPPTTNTTSSTITTASSILRGATEYKLSSAWIESGNSAVRDYDKRALESDDLQRRRPHTRRRRFGVDLARFFLGRPPFLPFSLAALAFASEVEAPPFAPPFVPQFRNISSTAFGSKSLIDLLDFFFVTSAILAR